MRTTFFDLKNIWSFNSHRYLYRDALVGVFTNMVSLSSRRKRAASQVILPQRSPPVPPGQANRARASSVAIEQLLKDVDFLDEEDIRINVDDDQCGQQSASSELRWLTVPIEPLAVRSLGKCIRWLHRW